MDSYFSWSFKEVEGRKNSTEERNENKNVFKRCLPAAVAP
jgi:hypothetical protein